MTVETLALYAAAAWALLGLATVLACLVCMFSLRILAVSRGYIVAGGYDGGTVTIYDENNNVVLKYVSSSYARQWLRLR